MQQIIPCRDRLSMPDFKSFKCCLVLVFVVKAIVLQQTICGVGFKRSFAEFSFKFFNSWPLASLIPIKSKSDGFHLANKKFGKRLAGQKRFSIVQKLPKC
jgi:hypothetical protein